MFIPLGIIAASGAAGGGAFESIATATGTGSSSTITFSSIPSTYQHLQIRGIGKITDTGVVARSMSVYANSDTTGTNYARHLLLGNGSTVSASGAASSAMSSLVYIAGSDATVGANVLGAFILDIHDYSSTTKYKTFRSLQGFDYNAASTSSNVRLGSGLWMNTAAITSISIVTDLGSFTTNTTFALYGIKGA